MDSKFNLPIGKYSFADTRLMLLDAWIRDVGHTIATYPDYRINCSYYYPVRFGLQYTISGEGIVEHSGKKHKLNPGSLLIINVPSDCTYYAPKGKTWEFIYISLEGVTVERLGKKAELLCGHKLELADDDQLLQLMYDIIEEAANGDTPDPWKNSEYAYTLMMGLLRHGTFTPVSSRQKKIEEAIIKSVEYAQRHLSDILDVKTLADCASMSRYHFSRIFKDHIGCSPGEYILRLRMEKSADLLQNTNMLVCDIAKSCGYHDTVHFGKIFRSRFKRTPLQFRKEK